MFSATNGMTRRALKNKMRQQAAALQGPRRIPEENFSTQI